MYTNDGKIVRDKPIWFFPLSTFNWQIKVTQMENTFMALQRETSKTNSSGL